MEWILCYLQYGHVFIPELYSYSDWAGNAILSALDYHSDWRENTVLWSTVVWFWWGNPVLEYCRSDRRYNAALSVLSFWSNRQCSAMLHCTVMSFWLMRQFCTALYCTVILTRETMLYFTYGHSMYHGDYSQPCSTKPVLCRLLVLENSEAEYADDMTAELRATVISWKCSEFLSSVWEYEKIVDSDWLHEKYQEGSYK